MLIYWENLNSSSLLDIKSFIYSHEKLRVQENNQNTFSFINQSQTSNDCDCMSILTIHSTSTWHKLNQKKKRITQYNYTLSSHHVHLSFIMYFFAQWVIIIKQENIIFDIIIMNITNAIKLTLQSKIENQSIIV